MKNELTNDRFKFRVYNPKTKSWVHGPGEEVHLFGEMILFGGFLCGISIKDHGDLVTLQFSGLFDTDGKEIFDGDIIEELTNNETTKSLGVCKSVIGGWRIFSHPDNSVCFHGWKAKVVGNVFDNSELLK